MWLILTCILLLVLVYKNCSQFVICFSKWKPSIAPQGATSLYQLVRMESFSVYCNPSCGAGGLVTQSVDLGCAPYAWRNEMRRGLETFSISEEDFDFSKCLSSLKLTTPSEFCAP
jgi:hypothetical protein